MYRIGADFGQVTGSLTMSTTSVALGTPVPASTQAQTRATISLMQMSLNRPPPNGINAGITPFTYVFDAKTENALKQFLRSKGVPDQIVPGMWTRIMKASGLSEAGAKNWEAAIAFHKKWAAPKITTPIAKMPVAKTLVAKTPTTKVTTLGPAPLPGAAEECARQGGNFKLISGRWTCLKPVQPTLAPAPTPTPTPTPVTPTPVETKTFVTYPAPDSGVAPLGPAPIYPGAPMAPMTPEQMMLMMGPSAMVPPTEKKKGMPTWGWVAIGLGGAAVVGTGIYLGIRHARSGA